MTARENSLRWMEKARITIATAVVTAAATSAYWVIAYDLFGFNGRPPINAAQAAAKSAPVPDSMTNSPAATSTRQPAKRVALEPVAPVVVGALAIPVVGVKPNELVDTFSQARDAGARVHDAIDIMAPLGTPVIAAAPGTVEKIWESDKGGHTVYVRSPDRRIIYYYAHLDGYAASLREKMALKAGDPIGIVGFSGNASPDGPHLHFAVMATEPDASWSAGTALNPYPLLTQKQ